MSRERELGVTATGGPGYTLAARSASQLQLTAIGPGGQGEDGNGCMLCSAAALLCILSLPSAVQCNSDVAKFNLINLCPGNSTAAEQLLCAPSASKLRCAAACRSLAACELFHFDAATRRCVRGPSTSQGLELWTWGSCMTYVLEGRLAAVIDGIKGSALPPIVQQLSLSFLYRFGTHGLLNVASPGNGTLQVSNAVVNSSGAYFTGSVSSRLTASMGAFSSTLVKGGSYSMFAVVRHPLSAKATYAILKRCDTTDWATNFYMDRGGPLLGLYVLSTGQQLYYTSNGGFGSGSSVAVLSIGITVNGSKPIASYENGSLFSTSSFTSISGTANDPRRFDCLILGADTAQNSWSLLGSMTCFAMSNRVLTKQEFEQTASWCLSP